MWKLNTKKAQLQGFDNKGFVGRMRKLDIQENMWIFIVVRNQTIMAIQSKFKLWAFLPVGLLLLVTGLLAVVTSTFFDKPRIPSFGVFVFFALFLFAWIWLVFGELRTKIIKAVIHESVIIVSNYLGLGKKKVYSLAQFEGFETALLPSKYDTYEYLYLIQNGKRSLS